MTFGLLRITVLLTARDPNKGNLAVNELTDKEGLDVIFYLLDVTNKDHIDTIYKQIEQRFGRLDALVNNAAIHYDPWQYAIWTMESLSDLHTINEKK